LALIATQAALTISGIHFMARSAPARVGYLDGKFIVNRVERPRRARSGPRVAGTTEGVLMVASAAKEHARRVMMAGE